MFESPLQSSLSLAMHHHEMEEEEMPSVAVIAESLWDSASNVMAYGGEFALGSVLPANAPNAGGGAHSNAAYALDFGKEWFSRRVGEEKIKESAKKHALSCGRGVPVISKEIINARVDPKDNGGKQKTIRKFLVWNWPCFFAWYYARTKREDRTYYENVFQGEPCRLYMDIEMECDSPLLEPSSLRATEEYEQRKRFVLDMLERTCEVLKAYYGEEATATRVYLMDSSSAIKYSNHVVFHLNRDKTRFKSSSDILNLVDFIDISCNLKLDELYQKQRATNAAEEWQAPKSWFQWSPSAGGSGSAGERCSRNVLDRAVYGKKGGGNEFRILGSTKTGKNRHLTLNSIYDPVFDSSNGRCTLLPSDVTFAETGSGESEAMWDTFETYPTYEPSTHDPIDRKYFFDTLVCYRPKGFVLDKLLTFEFRGRDYQDRAKTLKKKKREKDAEGDDERYSFKNSHRRSYDETDEEDYVETAERQMRREDLNSMPPHLSQLVSNYFTSLSTDRAILFDGIGMEIGAHYSSKFDSDGVEFVTYRASSPCAGGGGAPGRRTVSFKTTCQWCDIKDDYHGSNHVYYVADLVNKTWWMRCWNDGCKASIREEKNAKRMEYERNKAASTAGDAAKRMDPVMVFASSSSSSRLLSEKEGKKDPPNDHPSYMDRASVVIRDRDRDDDEDDDDDDDGKGKKSVGGCDFFERALGVLDDDRKASCRGASHEFDVSLWLPVQRYLKAEKETIDAYWTWVNQGRPTVVSDPQPPPPQGEAEADPAQQQSATKGEGEKKETKQRTRCAKRSYVHLESEREEKKRLIETLV